MMYCCNILIELPPYICSRYYLTGNVVGDHRYNREHNGVMEGLLGKKSEQTMNCKTFDLHIYHHGQIVYSLVR